MDDMHGYVRQQWHSMQKQSMQGMSVLGVWGMGDAPIVCLVANLAKAFQKQH